MFLAGSNQQQQQWQQMEGQQLPDSSMQPGMMGQQPGQQQPPPGAMQMGPRGVMHPQGPGLRQVRQIVTMTLLFCLMKTFFNIIFQMLQQQQQQGMMRPQQQQMGQQQMGQQQSNDPMLRELLG